MKYISIMLLCVAYSHAMDMIVKSDGAFEVLPLELRSKIAKNVFNLVVYEGVESKKAIDQELLEHYLLKSPNFLESPILLSVKLFHGVHRMQKVCQNKIGNKQFLPWQLSLLPSEQRDAFTRVTNRPYSSFGDIDADDYAIIAKVHEDIKKGLNFRVNLMDKKVRKVQCLGGFCFLLAVLGCAVDTVVEQNISVFIGAMGTVGGFGFIGLSEVLNWSNDNYHKEDPYWYLKKVEL